MVDTQSNRPTFFSLLVRLARDSVFTSVFILSLYPASQAQEQAPPLSTDRADATADVNHGENKSNSDLPDAPGQLPKQARRLTFGERVRIYEHSITNADSVLGPAFGAGINQARNEPPEWGQGASGFGTRFASGYGRVLIGRTIRFGIATLDHEDTRFSRSNESGFWRRTRYATVRFFVPRTDAGTPIPAFSRLAGTYGAAFISNEWYPASRANTRHALLRGTTALSASLGWNVFREFWPDIKNFLRRSQD